MIAKYIRSSSLVLLSGLLLVCYGSIIVLLMVTSVSIMAQTIAPNRTRVMIEQTESLTYPQHIDEFPSLTP